MSEHIIMENMEIKLATVFEHVAYFRLMFFLRAQVWTKHEGCEVSYNMLVA